MVCEKLAVNVALTDSVLVTVNDWLEVESCDELGAPLGVDVASWLAVIDGEKESVCSLLGWGVPVELIDDGTACDCVTLCVTLGEPLASCEALFACDVLAVGAALGDSVSVAVVDRLGVSTCEEVTDTAWLGVAVIA